MGIQAKAWPTVPALISVFRSGKHLSSLIDATWATVPIN
jgi:hypothetical protein